MTDFRLRLALVSGALTVLSACGPTPLPSTQDSAGIRSQYILPEEPCDPSSLDCGGGGGGDYPPTDPTPAPFMVHDVQELYNRAALLDISPASAAVNVDAARQSSSLRTLGFPTGASSAGDFITRLYGQAGWTNPNSTPSYGSTVTDPSCTNTPVNVNSPTQWFVGVNGTDPNFFAGAILQGASINDGPGNIRPIYAPAGKRASLNLTASYPAAMETNVVATLGDVNAAVGRLLTSAPADLNGQVYFEATEASSAQEAGSKLGIKGELGTLQASINSDTTNKDDRSTVFVSFFQAQYWVDVSLPARPIVEGLINNVTTSDLEGLGNTGQLAYDNLPTYVQRVIYGRRMIFSMSSNVSSGELTQTVTAAYGPAASGNLTQHQKNVITNSHIHVFSYGGPFSATSASIKDGTYKSYFTPTAPPNTMLPIGYDIRRWDGPIVRLYNPFSYTLRTCNPYKRVVLNFSDMYGSAEVFVLDTSGNPVFAGSIDRNGDLDITDKLRDGPNSIRVNSVSTRTSGIFGSYTRSINLDVLADDTSVFNPGRVHCDHCGSSEAYKFNINKTTGASYAEN